MAALLPLEIPGEEEVVLQVLVRDDVARDGIGEVEVVVVLAAALAVVSSASASTNMRRSVPARLRYPVCRLRWTRWQMQRPSRTTVTGGTTPAATSSSCTDSVSSFRCGGCWGGPGAGRRRFVCCSKLPLALALALAAPPLIVVARGV